MSERKSMGEKLAAAVRDVTGDVTPWHKMTDEMRTDFERIAIEFVSRLDPQIAAEDKSHDA